MLISCPPIHFSALFKIYFFFHLTSNEEISVEFARHTTTNVICVFLVGVELSGIWDVPKSTGVVVWRCEDLVTVWGEVCYVYCPEQRKIKP